MSKSLSEIFKKGFLLKDTNDDGLVDFLDAKIVVPSKAPAEVIVGASNLAARLGFETMALDLPLAVEDNTVSDLRMISNPILIGRQNRFIIQLIRNGAASLDARGQGIGLVYLHTEAESDQAVLCITGGDDLGTMKAATFLASETICSTGEEEPPLSALEETLSHMLSERGIAFNRCCVQGFTLNGSPPKIVAARVSVELKGPDELQRAEDIVDALAKEEPVLGQSHEDSGEVELQLALTSLGQMRTATLSRFMVKQPRKRTEAEVKHALRELSISKAYGVEGVLGASSVLIPDFTNTVLIPSEGAYKAIDVSARISLESTGVQIPLAKMDSEYSGPKLPTNPILFGSENSLSKRIIQSGQTSLPVLAPGQGAIQVASAALDNRDAILVLGNDPAGLHAASDYLASRIPYLWRNGKGEIELAQIEDQVRRFLSSRTGAGQIAAALYRLERILARLPSDISELGITVSASLTEASLDEFVKKAVLRAGIAVEPHVTCVDLRPDHGVTVIDEVVDLPWEVDELWDVLRKEVLSSIVPGCSVRIEARISEPPEIREKLKNEVMRELAGKGIRVNDTRVDILSAHKQGYSWLNDRVLPMIKETEVDTVTIGFAFIDKDEIRWQTVFSPTRWLQELYPIDEVLAKELHIPVEKVLFCKSTKNRPVYSVEVKNRLGQIIFEDSFNPKYVIRPMFSLFPEYEKVRVATGWLRVEVDGSLWVDRRIQTDPERFWDYYQEKALRHVHDNVMDVFEGAPRASKAPFFDKLEVELQMSEPDYRIGIDEEQISTLEALHEDIYFETLSFLDLLGLFYSGERPQYIGRIIPRVHASRPGIGATVKMKYLGKAASNPMLQISWRDSSGLAESLREDILPVDVKDPKTILAVVEQGKEGVLKLGLRIDTDSRDDRREQYLRVASSDVVDRQFLPTERAKRMIEILGEMHDAGLCSDELSYPFLQDLELELFSPEGRDRASLRVAKPAPDAEVLEKSREHPDEETRIVQWDKPISPTKCVELVKRLGMFPEVTPYKTGSSYLGRDIWAMDVMTPVKAALWSQAKASVWKPTLVLSGRQHANEVSSTSHILRLVEMLVKDDEYRKLLKRVNIVAHPIMNVDGATLGYELYEETPHFMLHAAYLGALGVDAGADQWNRDSVYPEARARYKLWRTWLPDIFLNPHGYPSHEWVQLFAEYGGWVRSRLPGAGRSWWIPRGWFMPGFSYIEDPRFPRHKEVAFAIRDYIVSGIKNNAEVRSMNERMYARRRKYGVFDPEVYKENLYKDVLIYAPLKGSQKNAASPSFMGRYPEITVFEASTEAPDETASGAWLELVCKAGLEFDLAHARFLYESRHKLERIEKQLDDGVLMVMRRERPVLPP